MVSILFFRNQMNKDFSYIDGIGNNFNKNELNKIKIQIRPKEWRWENTGEKIPNNGISINSLNRHIFFSRFSSIIENKRNVDQLTTIVLEKNERWEHHSMIFLLLEIYHHYFVIRYALGIKTINKSNLSPQKLIDYFFMKKNPFYSLISSGLIQKELEKINTKIKNGKFSSVIQKKDWVSFLNISLQLPYSIWYDNIPFSNRIVNDNFSQKSKISLRNNKIIELNHYNLIQTENLDSILFLSKLLTRIKTMETWYYSKFSLPILIQSINENKLKYYFDQVIKFQIPIDLEIINKPNENSSNVIKQMKDWQYLTNESEIKKTYKNMIEYRKNPKFPDSNLILSYIDNFYFVILNYVSGVISNELASLSTSIKKTEIKYRF